MTPQRINPVPLKKKKKKKNLEETKKWKGVKVFKELLPNFVLLCVCVWGGDGGGGELGFEVRYWILTISIPNLPHLQREEGLDRERNLTHTHCSTLGGDWSHYSDTSKPAFGYGVHNMITAQCRVGTSNLLVTRPMC
jgi:hypothetical protein